MQDSPQPSSTCGSSPNPLARWHWMQSASQMERTHRIAPTLFTVACGVATVLSAFLVFQIQPVISKMILPWFGGGPAVWTSCMMFFQFMLLAGYGYAYSLHRFLPIRWQALTHASLVLVALLLLPIIPGDRWKPVDGTHPTLRIVWILLANVGLPYFLLAATAPLFQAWYATKLPGRVPYRLYAISNAGSLLALLSFPFIVEPMMTSSVQAYVWAIGFVTFAVCCVCMAAIIYRTRGDAFIPAGAATPPAHEANATDTKISYRRWLTWMFLGAAGSFALLSSSNHICQELTVSPLMWVLPLSTYLLTFIVCFDRPQWFRPRWYATGTVVSLLAFAVFHHEQWDSIETWLDSIGCTWAWGVSDNAVVQTVFSLIVLFFICMLAHGELVRRKPNTNGLTSFYMALATGGAVGGMAVALVCPAIFSSFFETQISLMIGLLLAAWILTHPRRQLARWQTWAFRGLGGAIALAGSVLILDGNWSSANSNTLVEMRNFYGVLRVDLAGHSSDGQLGRGLYHGHTLHGFQFLRGPNKNEPTTYYSHDSGLAVAIRALKKDERPIHVGIIGLGVGTSAAYGQPGDNYHFYEIDSNVIRLANKKFSFLSDSLAQIQITHGDGRVAMERQAPQAFDLIALDAFSGDAIPAHLLTREAFAGYLKHLQPRGIIAVHISNRYFDLAPVVNAIADRYHLTALPIDADCDSSDEMHHASSKWVLLTTNEQVINDPEIEALTEAARKTDALPIEWTDQYSNLLHSLR